MTSQLNPEIQRERKVLAEGVILVKEYQEVINTPIIVGIFTWKVEVSTMSVVDFEVRLDKSENIELENKVGDELKTITQISPFETKIVAKIILKNDWKLISKFKLTMNVPEKSQQYKYIEDSEKTLQKNIKNFSAKLDAIPFEHLEISEIEAELNKGNTKFIDPDFLPNDEAVIKANNDENGKDYFDYLIHWRRPEDFIQGGETSNNEEEIEKEFRIFKVGGPDPNDIHQEGLPDNHLASSFSALAEKSNGIKRGFKTDKYSKQGIYQGKGCISGEWLTVVIDDLFPCKPGCPPLVSCSQSNELWIGILEKAMAKVFDCYYNLTVSVVRDFLIILTGCPTFDYNIDEIIKDKSKEYLINLLKQSVIDKKYGVIAVSKNIEKEDDNDDSGMESQNQIKEDDMLTIPNFGYTVVDIKKYEDTGIISEDTGIILHKVWYEGTKETKIQKYEEDIIKKKPFLENEKTVGTLMLRFDDFIKEFSSFSVNYTKNWDEIRIRGRFIAGCEQDSKTEVVLSKWYYSFQIEKETLIIITLFQDEDRIKEQESRKQLMDISLSILKQDIIKGEITHYQTLDFEHSSYIQGEVKLPPGQYIILPRTTGCFFGTPINKPEHGVVSFYNSELRQFNPVFINTIKDIFKHYDLQGKRKLSYTEFKDFWECIKRESIDKEYFLVNIVKKYQSFDGGITEKGLINFFKDEYFNEDGENRLRNWFTCLGYDNDGYPLKSRCFMLTFHSDFPGSVSVRDSRSTDGNTKVNKLILGTLGEEIKQKNEISVGQYQSKNSNISTIGCVNKCAVPYRVMMTFSDNGNCIYSGKTSKKTKIIQPGQCEFFLHYFSFPMEHGNGVEFNMEYYPAEIAG